jgi:hypothetical protein
MATAEKLTGTGNGPFIELPTFEPLGRGITNLLSVKLPQSSNLSLKYGSLVGINGDLGKVTSVNRKLKKDHYQILQSEESVSLLIGGNHHSNQLNHYKLVDINDAKQQWVVTREESLVAWTGYDFAIEPFTVFDKAHSVVTKGKGKLLLNSGNKQIDVHLQPDEKIYVSPSSLVAYTGDIELVQTNGGSGPRHQALVSLVDKIQTWDWVKQLDSTKFVQYLKAASKRPLMVEIRGPASVILSSASSVSNHKIFTVDEINKAKSFT